MLPIHSLAACRDLESAHATPLSRPPTVSRAERSRPPAVSIGERRQFASILVMSHTDPKGDSIAVSFSLTFLSQLLVTTTVVTVLTTFSIIPRYVRNSRCQSIFLLLIVLSVGGIAAWICHNLWLILTVILFTLIVALIECYSWAQWARIIDVCDAKNVLDILLCTALYTYHHS